MAELSLDGRCKLASELIEQSPPGEVNDVINDLRAIIGDDEALMRHVRPSLRTYNLTQLTAVEHKDGDVPAHSSLLSFATVLPGTSGEDERHVDAEGKRSFVFDHITLSVSDYQPYSLPEEEETFRAELAKSLTAYAKNHFSSGLSSVSSSQYPLLPPSPPPTEQATPAPVEAVESGNKEEGVVTDVVDEQVAAGDNEPAPTPAAGEVDVPSEEVVSPGGIEKVDEKVEGFKEEEQEEKSDPLESAVEEQTDDVKEDPEQAESEVKEPLQEPKVEEEGGEPEGSVAAPEQVEERKQERVENPTYTLEIVGNRYNPSNFWTGRWRTQWVVDQAAGSVSGTINVDVHYYEQGNVQLATQHTASFPCPVQANGTQSVASQIVTAIAKIETNYQMELGDVYDELGDKAFRALRRALPVTRQKMDWDKVGGYSLGSDLTKARG